MKTKNNIKILITKITKDQMNNILGGAGEDSATCTPHGNHVDQNDVCSSVEL
jgi:hypothetical protein